MRLATRWMIRRDLPEIVNIENDSFVNSPWSEDDFVNCLRNVNCVGKVVYDKEQTLEDGEHKIVGFIIYKLFKQHIQILNFAIDSKCRRLGIGSFFLQRVINNTNSGGRKGISCYVRESNLPIQLFFRAIGFKAVKILRGSYEDTGEDAYRMIYKIKSKEMVEASNL